MFRQVWRREGWPVGRMSFDHWDRLAALSHVNAAALELPGSIRARLRDRVLTLERSRPADGLL
jgi:hypothetical protein